MKPFCAFVASSLVLVTRAASAEEATPSLTPAFTDASELVVEKERPDANPWAPTPTAVRVSASGTLGFGNYTRTVTAPQSESGAALGGELRVHPYSMNGVLFAFGSGGALFGPTVTTVDLGYSFRPLAPRFMSGVTGAVYFDVGPSMGWVWPTEALHHDLGLRTGLALDLQVYNVTVGAQIVYHGGVPVDGPVPQQWESFYTAGVRAGFAFDFGRRPPPET